MSKSRGSITKFFSDVIGCIWIGAFFSNNSHQILIFSNPNYLLKYDLHINLLFAIIKATK